MQINYDRNHCCTAVCIVSLSSCVYTDSTHTAHDWYRTAFPDGELPDRIKEMDYWNPTRSYRLFSEGLALLCNNFQKYTADLCKESNPHNYPHWYGQYKIGDLSTVFCFTSTGDSQEKIEEFLEEFGFEASSKRGSKKYRGGSIVTLWSMGAAEFQKRCDEIIQEMRNEHEAHQEAIRPSVEAAAVPKSKEKTSSKSGGKTGSVSAAA